MTLAEETILRGTKCNSMYETNTVRGNATATDMNAYMAKESASLRNQVKIKPNAMKPMKFKEIDLNSLSPIIIK